MTWYELLLFVHVLGAAAWVGAVIFYVLTSELALRAGDRGMVLKLIEYDDKIAPLLYIPASLLVLAAGIGLTIDGPWSFGDGWIVVGLVILFGTFVLGVAFMIPTAKKVKGAVDSTGLDSDAVGALLGRFRFLSWLDLALLVVAVFAMTVKPFA